LTDAATPQAETPSKKAERRARRAKKHAAKRRFRLVWLPFWAGGGIVLLALLAIVGARFAILTDTGRTTLVGWLDGMEVGRFGTLQLSGLSGDVLGDFKVKRLAIVDEKGVWLEGRDVTMRWKSFSLLRRRLWAESVTATSVRVFRRPILEEREDKPKRDLPVAIRIDEARFRLITDPAFSVRPGDYNVLARTRVARDGPLWARIEGESLLRKGDGLSIAYQFANNRFDARVDAIEAAGGALAGSLGLPSDQQFVLRFRAIGQPKLAELSLQTRSGLTAPALADGRWNGEQGWLRAGVDLTAFDVTKPYVARIGDSLGISANVDPLEGQLFRLNAAIAADNLRATALGRVDVEKRASPEGLQVSAVTPDLSRLAGTPIAGLTEIEGLLTGDLKNLAFNGDGAVQRVAAGGYSLASITGPLDVLWRGGELTVDANLQGRGGAGKGLVGTWLGGQPRAEFQLARLKDGRLLIRSLEAVGAGMRVQGSGSRGLLGDLAFKGEGSLSNISSPAAGRARRAERHLRRAPGRQRQALGLHRRRAGRTVRHGLGSARPACGSSAPAAHDGRLWEPAAADRARRARRRGGIHQRLGPRRLQRGAGRGPRLARARAPSRPVRCRSAAPSRARARSMGPSPRRGRT
jgi:translocation and assembly module TamB